MPFQLVTPRELLAGTGRRVEWILPEVAPAGGKMLLSGATGLGKSLLATELAVASATGTPCLDTFRPWMPSSVVLFTADPRELVADRMTSFLAMRHEIDAPLLRIVHGSTSLDMLEGRVELREAVGDLRPKLVIIDPLEAFFSGERQAALELRTALSLLTDNLQATVMLVGNFDGPALEPSAGIFRAWAHVELQLKIDEERKQVMLTTADRARIKNEPPLLRFVIAPVMGRPRLPRLVPWPADPLPLDEARVYDVLRQNAMSASHLKRAIRARWETVETALKGLLKKGLIEPALGYHRIGIAGTRAYRVWRALPVTARKIDDPEANFQAAVRQLDTTGGEDWGALLEERRQVEGEDFKDDGETLTHYKLERKPFGKRPRKLKRLKALRGHGKYGKPILDRRGEPLQSRPLSPRPIFSKSRLGKPKAKEEP